LSGRRIEGKLFDVKVFHRVLDRAPCGSVGRVPTRIVTAIAVGDAEAAKRRMHRPFRAVPPLLK
jgi:hypothetical protein